MPPRYHAIWNHRTRRYDLMLDGCPVDPGCEGFDCFAAAEALAHEHADAMAEADAEEAAAIAAHDEPLIREAA